jgi:serine/threonine-protein kinase
VHSEHIVQVFDAGIDPDSSLVFVAMELLTGSNLSELVRARGPVSASEAAEYLRQVALGLDKVHGVVDGAGRPAPIVHRDLKPANLFLTRREDGTAWIKILDFGAAKMLSEDSQASSILRATPEYMAYEQAAGGEVTPATDIWAFGLIAFYLLTGEAYWRGAKTESGRAQIFGEVLTLPLVPASERARELGATVELAPAFDAWFFRCVNREPAARFASAGEAARSLAEALAVSVHPVAAPPLSELPVVTQAPSTKSSGLSTRDLSGVAASSRGTRGPARFSLGALIVLLLGLNLVGAFLLWSRTRSPEDGAARDAGSSAAPPAPQLAPVPPPELPSPAAPSASVVTTSRAALPGPATQASTAPHTPGSRAPARGATTPDAAASAPSGPKAAPGDDVYDVR